MSCDSVVDRLDSSGSVATSPGLSSLAYMLHARHRHETMPLGALIMYRKRRCRRCVHSRAVSRDYSDVDRLDHGTGGGEPVRGDLSSVPGAAPVHDTIQRTSGVKRYQNETLETETGAEIETSILRPES